LIGKAAAIVVGEHELDGAQALALAPYNSAEYSFFALGSIHHRHRDSVPVNMFGSVRVAIAE
jgi:hypothetical protein